MNIPLPKSIAVQEVGENQAIIELSPCYPGYGTTIGNALRRVLLSSLPGAAATAMKIKGVEHEFSTIDHVKEDVVEIILNIKTLRFRSYSDEPVEIELNVKGEKVVTAADFEKNSDVEVINTDAVIATLTDPSAEFTLKITVQNGIGYIPVEDRDKEKLDVGYIAVDSIYTPVRNVNFKTEHVRVGQMTNYDKLLLDISTDGTMTPEDAFRASAKILVDQFSFLIGENTVDEIDVQEIEGVDDTTIEDSDEEMEKTSDTSSEESEA